MAEQWLSIVEYARASGISDMTIRRRIRTGKLKAELKDGKYYIPVDLLRNSKDAAPSHTANHSIVKPSRHADHSLDQNTGRSYDSTNMSMTDKIMPVIMRSESANQINHGVQPNQIPNWLTHGGQAHHHNQYNVTNSPRLSAVPENLSRPLIEMGQASVEARSLLEFCDQALDQARSTVRAVESKYAAKVESLSSQLSQKDQEIRSLNQQIEDLQLLVQILERKKV